MLDVKKILFPTDFSETAKMAKAHAIALARCLGADITSLHVRTMFQDDPRALAKQLRNNGSGPQELRIDPAGAASDFGAEPRVRTVIVRDISPADAILNYIEREGADLVVMGTHGRTGLKHFMLGSVSEEVVRESPVPVVTVGPNTGSSTRYHRILVGFDYSIHSSAALLEAAQLAKVLDARLQVLFVVHQEIHPAYQEYHLATTSRALPVIEEELRKAVAEILPDEQTAPPKITAMLGTDKTAREISEFAAEANVNLIVLGTHGFSGLNRLLLGSTSEQVMRLAACPVLTVRPAKSPRTQKTEVWPRHLSA